MGAEGDVVGVAGGEGAEVLRCGRLFEARVAVVDGVAQGADRGVGFIDIHEKDKGITDNQSLQKGGFSAGVSSYDYITQSVKDYDENRFLNQFEKVELVKGDATITIPEFMSENQHLIISYYFFIVFRF